LTYTSLEFLLFVSVAVVLCQFCPVRFRSVLLLAASYGFYLTWSAPAAAALAAVTVLTFVAGKWVANSESPHRAKILATFVVCLLTGYLAFFKIAAALPSGTPGRMAMPLGMSYYTFKLIAYVMDVYWGKLAPERRFLAFASYVAFFPQIVAGPIQRPGDFLRQSPPVYTAVRRGVPRIAWGLAKKVLIADNLEAAINYLFGHVTSLHGAQLLAGFYLFPLYLYVDFSGLTDIAIGTGLLFGIEAPENFNRPFTASAISEYWRRWHMSRTSWLGDYVLSPLRMATRAAGAGGLAFSLTVNMVAIGMWHGVTWGYLVFSLINAAALVADALTSRRRARFFKANPRLNSWGARLGVLFTFHLVATALVFFRAQSIQDAWWLLGHALNGLTSFGADMAHLAAIAGAGSFVAGLAGLGVLELCERYRPDRWWLRIEVKLPWWLQRLAVSTATVVLLAVIFVLLVRGGREATPFLYQAF
jgi:alginate O-acetyltransferase complex protein AlgI